MIVGVTSPFHSLTAIVSEIACFRQLPNNVRIMNNIDPKILELAKRDYGENCELVKRTEWSYSFKCGEKSYCSISRFMAEKDFEVSAAEIRRRWPTMNESDQLDFVSNFYVKDTWNENDTEILEIVMLDGNDFVWRYCALAFLKHPDRDRAVRFLIERMQHHESGYEPLNYIQALGIAGDRRAVPAIRPYYEEYLQGLEAETAIGVPDDVVFGPIPYHAYFATAGALFKIDGSQEYELGIRKYFDHPNEQVRWWAENALEIEGPTTAKRNAEYQKKRNRN
jgi:hypothetical protein